jgi:RNA polymerase sigma factor (TIGR02999 family)
MDGTFQTGVGEVTALLRQVSAGVPDARDRLFKLMYPELKRMAVAQMARERKDHTLQPTALVNEAFLRLPPAELSVRDRAHFLAVAANAMRHILVDHARGRLSRKRGNGRKEPLDERLAYDPQRPEDMVDLDRALERLEAMSPRQARVVEMRFFGGLNEGQIAEVLAVSARTVKRDWRIARAWLYGELVQLQFRES